MGDDQAEEAADKAVDPDRLLEGEDPSTTYLDDATHWVTVYSELLGGQARPRRRVGEPPS